MKRTALLLLLVCLLLGHFVGCQSTGTAKGKGEGQYPELGVVDEYRHVAKVMTDKWTMKKHADQRERISEFIFQRVSPTEFENLMVTNSSALMRGHSDVSFRGSTEYLEAKQMCQAVTTSMAIMVVAQTHDVYRRKILQPDEMTAPLFAASKDRETDEIISWIEKEVTLEEFQKGVENSFDRQAANPFVPQVGDRFYYYNSPPFSWQMMFGREGYAVFRNGTMVYSTLIAMN